MNRYKMGSKETLCAVCRSNENTQHEWDYVPEDRLFLCSTECINMYEINPLVYESNTVPKDIGEALNTNLLHRSAFITLKVI